jgi:gluconolactonase
MATRLESLYDTSSVTQLATGFGFTEGPLWHPEGYWLFVDLRASRIHRLRPGHDVELFRENTNGGNGMTLDQQGRLILCEGTERRLTRTELDGSITVLVDNYRGQRFHRPNDVVLHPDGSIYFTDPGFSVNQGERFMAWDGLYRLATDGALSLVSGSMTVPNGLAFSPDLKTLYVANTRPMYLAAFDLQPDGSWGLMRVIADMWPAEPGVGVPDGMKVDEAGRLWVTGPHGLHVFEPDGTLIGRIDLPEVPANLAWGGEDRRTALLTARTSVYSFRVSTPGLPLA